MIGDLVFNSVCVCVCVCARARARALLPCVLQWFPMVTVRRNKNQLEVCLRILLIRFS